MNKELTLVKSVMNYKHLRHSLYNWGLVIELSNKLFLLFSVFFLFLSIFEIIIGAPPFLAGVCAISLTSAELSPDKNDLSFTFVIFGVQLAHSLMGLIVAVMGIVVKNKLDIDLAKLQVNVLNVSLIVLTSFMVVNGIFTHFYIEKAYDSVTVDPVVDDHVIYMSRVIMIILTTLGSITQACMCLILRKVHLQFNLSLQYYVKFLLKFEETPRSKISKKYIPPLDPLQEETSSYNETIRSNSHLVERATKFTGALGFNNSTIMSADMMLRDH